MDELINRRLLSNIESQLDYYSEKLTSGDFKTLALINFLLHLWRVHSKSNENEKLSFLHSVVERILLKVKDQPFNSAEFYWLIVNAINTRFGIPFEKNFADFINLKITLEKCDHRGSSALLEIIEKCYKSSAEIDQEMLTECLKSLIEHDSWLVLDVTNRLSSIPQLEVLINRINSTIKNLFVSSVKERQFNSIYGLLSLVSDDELEQLELHHSIEAFLRLLIKNRHRESPINLELFYSTILSRKTSLLAKLVEKIEWRIVSDDVISNVILSREGSEFDVANCFSLAVFEKRHFLIDLLDSPLSAFDEIPDQLKVTYLLENIMRCFRQQKFDEGCQFINFLEVFLISQRFSNLYKSEKLMLAIGKRLNWIYSFLHWSMDNLLSVDGNRDCYKLRLFEQLINGVSPLTVLSQYNILGTNCDVRRGCNESEITATVTNLLQSSGDSRELTIWQGYSLIRETLIVLFSDKNNIEPGHFLNGLRDLINSIYPLQFRIELIENLFSLLFLTRSDFYEPSADIYRQQEHDVDDDGYAEESILSQMKEIVTNSPKPARKHSADNKTSPLHNGYRKSIGVEFIFPNFLVADYLKMLKEVAVKANTSLFTLFRRDSSENGDPFLDVSVNSSITNINECRERSKNLIEYINQALWRHDCVEPAFRDCGFYAARRGTVNSFEESTEETQPRLMKSGSQSGEVSLEESSDARAASSGNNGSIFNSFIPSLLASPDQLLRYCLIESNLKQAGQVYEIFTSNLKDSPESYEMFIAYNLSDLATKLRNLSQPIRSAASSRLNETATKSLKVAQIQSILHQFLINVNEDIDDGCVDTSCLLLDFAMCQSFPIVMCEDMLETALREYSMKSEVEITDESHDRMNRFLSQMTNLLPLYRSHEEFGDLTVTDLLAYNFSPTLFTNGQSLLGECERLGTIKQCIINLKRIFAKDLLDIDSLEQASMKNLKKIDSKEMAIQYEMLMENCCATKFNYLKALFYHVRKVSECLAECRSRLIGLQRGLTSTSSDENDLRTSMILENHGTFFSVLHKSPSAILCRMIVKFNMSPRMLDDLASKMKVDLIKTLCSVLCPRIPLSSQVSSEDFEIIDSVHPALCQLIKNFLSPQATKETPLLIPNHFGSVDDLSEDSSKNVLSHSGELVNYLRSKNPLFIGLLRLLNCIGKEMVNDNDLIIDDKSPLKKWISLVKKLFCYVQNEDNQTLITLALNPSIPVAHSLVRRILEKCAVNRDYVRLHKILMLMDLSEANSPLLSLQSASLYRLSAETNDIRYVLQMKNPQKICDLTTRIIFETDIYVEANSAERALRAALSRLPMLIRDDGDEKAMLTLQTNLDKVLLFAKLASLSGLKSWLDAYRNLSTVDILTILKSRRCYPLAYEWSLLRDKNEKLSADVKELMDHLLLQAYCEKKDFLAIDVCLEQENFEQIAAKVLPFVEDLDCRNYFVERLLKSDSIRSDKEKCQYYLNYQLGLKLITDLPNSVRVYYEPIVAKPMLIVEQILMNCEYQVLEQIIKRDKLIQGSQIEMCDRLIETYARKAAEINLGQSGDSDSITGSDTTMISSVMNEISYTFVMPETVPSREQWIPDARVTHCMMCKAVQFSMFNRKHHCRRCGRVVCGQCSTKLMIIPEVNQNLPVRICDDCYQQTKNSERDRKESVCTTASGQNVRWILTTREIENETTREEFYYESAPSSSLCLSILKLHSNRRRCAKMIIDQISRPMFEILGSHSVDYALIINLNKSLLFSASILIHDENDDVLSQEIEFLLGRIDIVKMLVVGSCLRRDLIVHVISKENAWFKLLEKLIEMERFDLASHIATKYGLNLKPIWKTWAIVCLKNGQFSKARKKFRSCFMQTESDKKLGSTPINSKLLEEIFDVIEKLKGHVSKVSLLERCKAIADGKHVITNEVKKGEKNEDGTLPPVLLEEARYYLENYGSVEDSCKFYVRFGIWREAIKLFIGSNNQTSQLLPVFVSSLFLPALTSGKLQHLLKRIQEVDPVKRRLGRYLIYTCQYLSSNNCLHTLYHIQLWMFDYLRAAITQIMLFMQPKVADYGGYNERLGFLQQAKKHCHDFLNYQQTESLNKGFLTYTEQEVNVQIRTLDLQIDVTTKFNEDKANVSRYFTICEEYFRSSNEESEIPVSSLGISGKILPTLLDGNIAPKIQIAAILMIESGADIAEGFEAARQIINAFDLDEAQVYRLFARILMCSQRPDAIKMLSDLLDLIRKSMKEDTSSICDDIVSAAMRSCETIEYVEPLIKLLKSDVNKIDAYIYHEKLKPAYIMAVKLNRMVDVKRIHEMSVMKKHDAIRKLCEAYLKKKTES